MPDGLAMYADGPDLAPVDAGLIKQCFDPHCVVINQRVACQRTAVQFVGPCSLQGQQFVAQVCWKWRVGVAEDAVRMGIGA